MAKPSKAKTPENLGKGTVTPVQIAFLVEQYLSDNSYSESRSVFRTEASSLFSKSPIREVPKSLLSLSEILNEYIELKEQKVMLDHEKARVEQEKARVQTLLNGLQNSMNIYNAGGNPQISTANDAVAPKQMLMAPQPWVIGGPSAAIYHPAVTPTNPNMGTANFCSPVTNNPPATKRKGFIVGGDPPPAAKRYRSRAPSSKIPNKGEGKLKASGSSLNNQGGAPPTSAVQSPQQNCAPSGSFVQGSTVAKCLFTQPSVSNTTNSSVPQTPPRAISPQSDKSVSPVENSANSTNSDNSPPEIRANCCTIFSSKRVTLTPTKACYTVETNHCISSSPAKTNTRMSSRREHVKGRLNFDSSDVPVGLDKPVTDEISADKPIIEDISPYKPIGDEILTSGSEKEVDIFDMDMPNFEALGVDFNFTEMLGDLDFDYGELGFTCQPSSTAVMGNVSGSPHANMDGNEGASQVMSEFSSTVTELISEKGTSAQGPDSMTTMKSVTKCIRIISPVKKRGNSVDQENSTEIN